MRRLDKPNARALEDIAAEIVRAQDMIGRLTFKTTPDIALIDHFPGQCQWRDDRDGEQQYD